MLGAAHPTLKLKRVSSAAFQRRQFTSITHPCWRSPLFSMPANSEESKSVLAGDRGEETKLTNLSEKMTKFSSAELFDMDDDWC